MIHVPLATTTRPKSPARGVHRGRIAGLACTGVLVLSAVIAAMQAAYGNLLSDVGLSGVAGVVAAVALGFFDGVVVIGGCALVVWLCGTLLRAPDNSALSVLAVVSCALLAAVTLEAFAAVAELLLTGRVPVVLGVSLGRWTGVAALGGLSVSNVLLAGGLSFGLARRLRWSVVGSLLPGLTILVVAVGAAALTRMG
jgi:hypothetical protein